MNKRVQIAIIAVCFGAAAVLLWRFLTAERPGADERARIMFFLCADPECAAEYAVRPGEDLGERESDECPTCGKYATPAARCPACGRHHPEQGHGRYLETCPHCGAKMPPLAEQLREAERALGG